MMNLEIIINKIKNKEKENPPNITENTCQERTADQHCSRRMMNFHLFARSPPIQ